VWSDSYDRVLEDIFEVQSDIARQVIANLEVALIDREQRALEALPTDNMEAYNAYLRAGQIQRGTRNEHEIAGQLLERAVELDPDFALAHATLSGNHTTSWWRRYDRSPKRLELAIRAAERALELDPDLPEGHVSLGWFYDTQLDYERALAEYEIAADLRPNDAGTVRQMAVAHRKQGRWREASAGLERAVELDPQNHESLRWLATTYSWASRHREAMETIDRAIALAPDRPELYVAKHNISQRLYGPSDQSRCVLEEAPGDFPGEIGKAWMNHVMDEGLWASALEHMYGAPEWAPDWWFSLTECECYLRLEGFERSRRSCDAARDGLLAAVTAQPDLHSTLGWAFALLGDREEAIRHGRRGVELMPVSRNAQSGQRKVMMLARIYAWVGEPDEAFELIETLLTTPGPGLSVAELRLGRRWDPLRDQPRFAEILEKYDEEEPVQ
jgi:tetratricopeptide (TPR) repeat protein